MALLLHTQQEQLVLRELESDEDDVVFFESIQASHEHLRPFCGETLDIYKSLDDVRQARVNPRNPDALRMGIFLDEDVFVGAMTLTPDKYGSAEIGIWLDERRTGHGYATVATLALTGYARKRYDTVYAKAAEANRRSTAVLERTGYERVAEEAGRLIFVATGVSTPWREMPSRQRPGSPAARDEKAMQDLARFEGMPNSDVSLQATDKKRRAVYIFHGVAKREIRCSCCDGAIGAGDSHAIVKRVHHAQKPMTHRMDMACLWEKILPGLSEIRASEASLSRNRARPRSRNGKNRRT